MVEQINAGYMTGQLLVAMPRCAILASPER